MQIFLEKDTLTKEHNKEAHVGKRSYYVGHNEFSDSLPEEENARLSASEHLDLKRSILNAPGASMFSRYTYDSTVSIPASLDWSKIYDIPVGNQGHCGCCWAFSATGAMSYMFRRKCNAALNFSQAELVDCSSYNSGCKGGNPYMAFYDAHDTGLTTEEYYPFTYADVNSTFVKGSCQVPSNSPHYKISGFKFTQNDIQGLQQMVAVNGPTAILFDASTWSFQHYQSGIYDGSDPSRNAACTTKISHAMVLVGYGNVNNTDVWIIRNQYGTSWGVNGYMYLKRDSVTNLCGFANWGYVPYVNDCSQVQSK